MCGILSISGKGINAIAVPTIKQAIDTLSRRGPDDRGTLTLPGCILGHTRLSIIDLNGGHQPMHDKKEGVAISFNGEIYNYAELKKELEAKGYTFSTNSDTEVILKAYREYGPECLLRLDGMFAFALWDERNQSLFLARDRFGKKPLYYTYDGSGNLTAASEIKTLEALGIKGELDRGAIDNYLTLMYIPPHKTVYKNIFSLRPAEYGIWKEGSLVKKTYWQLEKNPISISREEAKGEIKRLFGAAVKKRLVADVEVGSFLSGGVDSTLVSATAQRFMDRPLKTFSLGYGTLINELPYAEAASKKIGSDHHTLQAADTSFETIRKALAYFDEPHADSSDFPQSLLSELTKKSVKVALSGDGADELFMGYGWYQKHWHLPFGKRLAQSIFSNAFADYLKNISVFGADERKKLWNNDSIVNNDIFLKTPAGSPIKKINDFDLTAYLPGQLLTKIDRMGMMHGLEVRSPFLDQELAEFVYSLPTEYKMNRRENKIILKEILAEIMPKEFVYRRKQGFGAPITAWLMMKNWKELVYATVGNTNHALYQLLIPSYPAVLLRDFYEKGDHRKGYRIWVLLCLALWLENRTAFLKKG